MNACDVARPTGPAQPLTVLKFGSSVLRTPVDLPTAVDEIYRRLRAGERVVAVVSAFAGETDELLAAAREAGGTGEPHVVAQLVATGETRSAALLTLALDRHGVPARLLDPAALGLAATGPALDAELTGLDVSALERAFEHAAVAVVPGFCALDESGRTVLLGRGGSDFTALFIAERAGGHCVLIKDVDGLYERDPALAGPRPRRLAAATWDDALRVAGRLVQPKTIRFAHQHRQAFTVSAAGAAHGTLIGAGPTRTEGAAAAAPLDVVLLGLGTVGRGVYERLAAHPAKFHIRSILVRDAARHTASGVPANLLTTDPDTALAPGCDLVIELLGGLDPAGTLIERALAGGARVVTANKAIVATRWAALAPHAADGRLAFAAAAGGAVPVLETLQLLAGTGTVTAVRAVINGTCNFILDELARGIPYADALAEAQALGFAERDPTADVSGLDAEHKLRLCSLAAYGREPDVIERRGIDTVAAELVEAGRTPDRALRLVATLQLDGARVLARIAPEVVDAGDFLAGARAEGNRAEITLADGGVVRLSGKGAGRWPTTAAVLGDVWNLTRAAAVEALQAATPQRAVGR